MPTDQLAAAKARLEKLKQSQARKTELAKVKQEIAKFTSKKKR